MILLSLNFLRRKQHLPSTISCELCSVRVWHMVNTVHREALSATKMPASISELQGTVGPTLVTGMRRAVRCGLFQVASCVGTYLQSTTLSPPFVVTAAIFQTVAPPPLSSQGKTSQTDPPWPRSTEEKKKALLSCHFSLTWPIETQNKLSGCVPLKVICHNLILFLNTKPHHLHK